jgi:hypothetical protein
MKKNPKHPKSAPKKEDLTTNKGKIELTEQELNRVTGGFEIKDWSLPIASGGYNHCGSGGSAGKIVIQGG